MNIKIENLTGATPERMAREAVRAVLANKGINTKLFNVTDSTVIADYYVITTARSTTHVKSLSDDLVDKFAEAGVNPSHFEGRDGGEWILIDYDNIIIHVFGRDAREFYNLERLGGEEIDKSDIEEALDREMSASEN